MKKKRWMFLLLFLIVGALFYPAQAEAATPTPIPTPTPVPVTLQAIYASYTGETIPIGGTISRDDISVMGWYSDGTIEEVTDYVLSSDKVTIAGVNTFTVVYMGKINTFTVYGKKAQQLYANYFGGSVSIGNSVGRENISVMVSFSDGSLEEVTDYVLGNYIITTVGTQKVYVNYGGMSASFDVTGMAAKTVAGLYASYTGGEVAQGNTIPEKDLIITAVYTDNTAERIYNYTLSPATINDIGTNTVTAYYRGQVATFTVECIVKTLESISAVYNGDKVEVGRYVDPADITVTATYNDNSKEEIKDFSLLGSRITILGNNRVTVSYFGLRADIMVQGIQRSTPSYDHAAVFTVKNEKNRQATVQVALPKTMDTSGLTGRSLKASTVSKILGKAGAQNADYIAFDVILADETKDDIFPLTMKLTLPAAYVQADTCVYYTPNRKTVIGKLSAEKVGTRELEVTIYYEGTYILAYQKPGADEGIDDSENDYLD